MKIVYRGNFGVPHSTESHVAWSLEDLGVQVVRLQENEVSWSATAQAARGCDLFLWTQTYGFATNWHREDAFTALAAIGCPKVGYHLDLWWGLDRQWMLSAGEPFFTALDLLVTADGDHDDDWARVGVNHRWLPPAVFGRECGPGTRRPEYDADITFVGSWRSYAHGEWWPKRKAMIDYLDQRYGPWAFRKWPKGPAVRGQQLNDVYASARITVGDSCLADRSRRYFSDRAFEVVGRGGFLITPYVEALAELLTDGEHCRFYTPGHLDELGQLIDYYLAHPDERETIRNAGQQHVAARHTYADRMRDVLALAGLKVPA